MHPLLPIGSTLTGVLTAGFALDPELRLAAWLLLPFAILQLFGSSLVILGHVRFGARLALLASVPVIPAGLLCALGARQTLDELVRREGGGSA